MSNKVAILTHLNCPKPAHSGQFLGGDKISDFVPGIEGAHSNFWPVKEGDYTRLRCEGCEATVFVEEGEAE